LNLVGLNQKKQKKLLLLKQAHSYDKALHALCEALSPSEFARISNCEVAKDAWQILETAYEGTKLVKSTKLQILISKF
jgi:UTP:GlnB (protein PII) uridylyltransferase